MIKGCDASVLLDAVNGIHSEKDSLSNETLEGFDIIDSIKEELEATYPGIVSCADILLLAAREGVVRVKSLSMCSCSCMYAIWWCYEALNFRLVAYSTLWILAGEKTVRLLQMSQHMDSLRLTVRLRITLASFASRGFIEKETVSFLGIVFFFLSLSSPWK